MAAMTQDLKTLRIAIQAIHQQAWTHDSRNRKLSVLREHVEEMERNYSAKDYTLWGHEADLLPDSLKAVKHYLRDTAYGEIHTMVLRRLWVAVDIISFMLGKIENTSPREKREARKAQKKDDVWRDALDEIEAPNSDEQTDSDADLDPSA